MAALKWVYVVLLIILLFELGSCRILSDQKDQESSKPDNPGFLAGVGGTWKGIPFLGIRAGGGFLGIGSDRHGKGTFGAGRGGGGFNGGTSWPTGCNIDSTKSGGAGGYPTHSNPSGPPVTCRPMNCSNESVSYCEGYRRYLDSSPPHWCKVPWIGTLPFWCKGGLRASGQPLHCKPINCLYRGACEGAGGYLGHVDSFWPYSHGGQKNQDDRPSEVTAPAENS